MMRMRGHIILIFSSNIWNMSLPREQETADKYKKLTIRYQVEFTIILFYGIIVTALQVIATPKLV